MRRLLLSLVACGAALAAAQGATPVALRSGETLALCTAGLFTCPASAFLCDDPKVAVIENGPDGALLRGVSPGTTLCSVFGFERASHAVLKVTVRKP